MRVTFLLVAFLSAAPRAEDLWPARWFSCYDALRDEIAARLSRGVYQGLSRV